jgi:solute carrier family 25 oxoglutarate transporter 11
MSYTTARVWGFLTFYDWINQDPRRTARPDYYVMAGLGGGMLAGVLTNPIEMVFARQQADELYSQSYRRNYKSFTHGLMKVVDEGVMFRGAAANGLKYGMLCASMTNVYDLIKENTYYWFGPSFINRLVATLGATLLGTMLTLPFDAIRLRMHLMRPLPNGELPYTSSMDCAVKM